MKNREIAKNQTAKTTRRVLAEHGIPKAIVTDNGPDFLSSTATRFMIENGVKSKLDRSRKLAGKD